MRPWEWKTIVWYMRLFVGLLLGQALINKAITQAHDTIVAEPGSRSIPTNRLLDLQDKINRETRLARAGHGAKPELFRWGQSLLDYVRLHPNDEDASGDRPAYLIYNSLFWCWELDGMEEARFLNLMKESPNAFIRNLGESRARVAALRTSPWEFSFTALDGRSIDLAQLRGKVVFVDGWSIFCSTCIEQMPKIKRLREKYRDYGFEVIGICFVSKSARDEAKSLRIIADEKVDWPTLMLRDQTCQQFMDRYGIRAFPMTWLFDRDGRLITSRGLVGEELEAEVRKALGLPLPVNDRLNVTSSDSVNVPEKIYPSTTEPIYGVRPQFLK